MKLEEAIRKRLDELVKENKTNYTALSLNSNITPSTIFDFLYNKSKSPTIKTIRRLCRGCGITLREFFDRDYFNNLDEE